MRRTIRAATLRTSVALTAAFAMTFSSLARAEPPVPAAPASTLAETELPPPAPTAPAASAAPEHHVALYTAGGLAIAAAGVGTAFGILALHAKSDFESQPTKSHADTANNDAAYCDASFGLAALAAATTVVFFLVAQRDSSTRAPPALSFAVTPLFAPLAAGAGAVFTF